jgi:hypothetical protein
MVRSLCKICPYGGDGCAWVVRRSEGRVAPVLGCMKRVKDSRRDRRQRRQGIVGFCAFDDQSPHIFFLINSPPLHFSTTARSNHPYPIQSIPLSSSFFLRKYCPTLRHFPPPQTGRQFAHSLPSTSAGQRHEGCLLASSIRIVQIHRRHRLQWLREGVGGVVVVRPAHAAPPCAIRVRLVLASAAQAVIAASHRKFSYPYRSLIAAGESHDGGCTQRRAAGKAHIEGLTCSTIAAPRHHTFNATMTFSNFADMYLHQITHQNGLRRLRVPGQAGRAGRAL